MNLDKKARLAVVISHATQHFAPLYAHLAATQEIELKVFFVAENGVSVYRDQQFGVDLQWDVPLNQGYQHQFLNPGLVLDEYTFFTVDSDRINAVLREFDPDVVWIHGYAQRINWRIVVGKSKRWKLLYSSDSNLADHRSVLRKVIKAGVVRLFFSRCDHFLSISPSNTKYLNSFGINSAQISETTFPIDITRLSKAREALLDSAALNTLREALSLEYDMPIFLFAGKLIDFKRPQDVLLALKNLAKPAMLIYVGNGPELEQLKQMSAELGLTDQVRFTGFINQSELAQYFSLADFFVFPSEREPYGAISAEILPFGLPIIASQTVGAIGKSIIEDQNALLYESGNIHALAQCMQVLLDQPDTATRFASNSAALAPSHDKSVMAHDIIKYCRSVLSASHS